MKIVCYKDELLKGVNIVLKAVPSHTTMPILQCILIQAYNGHIKLTANDMELGIETIIAGNILEQGSICLEAKVLSDIVRKLPDNDVTIESNNERFNTIITCEKACFTLNGKDGDDFTHLPDITDKEKYISISQFDLKEVIRQTIFAISTNESKKIMSGELMEVNGNVLKMYGLDGFRVAIRKVTLKDDYGSIKVVVPGKTLSEVSKILTGDAESETLIYFTNNHIIFEFDDTIVVSRLIEGEFLNVSRMIFSDYETIVKVNKKDLMECIDRATLLVKESDQKPIIVDINDERIEMKVTSALGSLEEDMEVEKEGKDIMLGFNPRFIMDALKVIDDETVSMYIVNSSFPFSIKDEEENYVYLILPVRFNPAQ